MLMMPLGSPGRNAPVIQSGQAMVVVRVEDQPEKLEIRVSS